ncbi:hypothetical protein AALO_G00002870 [Alosa alosa]|uniref:RabBD domain-containing protein n=1 Tax=Alosa alosa TaxID=278164 RepID=A0AAV6HDL9_9TELE|nr:hypothetical protein AALO_G00002870 [Alosa alosa]
MSEAGEMGRKLDLSGLSEAEAQHVLQVVQRDMKLREKEEARLSEMKQELDAEGSRCTLLSRQHRFNERCCIRCCAPFTFLLNPKRPCLDCQYNVCKCCCTYSRRDKAWLCSACQKSRLLKTQSLEWYYNNVRRRFKRFGSAKVLKTLYRKHAAEQGNLTELTEESTYAESTGNEGSVCDSDSAFYKQIEEHNMADTITVALRVAEEAIDEAITKAETYTDSQEKQREAQYLRENREELIEELATTIVHKIIRRRRDLSDMQPDYNLDWPLDEDGELLTTVPRPTAPSSPPLASSPPSGGPVIGVRGQTPQSGRLSGRGCWLVRSRSAFSLLTDGTADAYQQVQNKEDVPAQPPLHGLKKEGLPILPTWKSVDRLDNSSASAVLQSPDGNWIALQSTLLSRPSLLAKRKSLVFSVLEKESGVVSAYDEMGSDTEVEPEGAFGAALLEFRRKMKSRGSDVGVGDGDGDGADGADGDGGGSADPDTADSDLDGAPVKKGLDGARLRYHKPLLSLLKKKKASERRRTPPRRPSIIDMNFNPEAADSSEADEAQAETPTRTRRRRRSRREHLDDSNQLEPYSSSVPECSTLALDDLVRMRNMMMQQETPVLLTPEDDLTSDTATPDILSSGKPGEEEREGLNMATVSGKVPEDAGARGLREESSSSDPNPYPSPDDVNKDRYGLELAHNLHLISNLMQQKYSAASLRSVTTEMLRVLNATEDLIQGAEGSIEEPVRSDRRTSASISPGQSRKLDEQLSKLEENVYVAASTAYGLEGELSDLEACARRIGQSTNERELAHLEDQVASAAAQVQQSELQVTDIAARIAALKTAGLNVAPQTRLFKPLKPTKTQTIDTSRQQRRRLPAPPTKEKETTDI